MVDMFIIYFQVFFFLVLNFFFCLLVSYYDNSTLFFSVGNAMRTKDNDCRRCECGAQGRGGKIIAGRLGCEKEGIEQLLSLSESVCGNLKRREIEMQRNEWCAQNREINKI